jgi:pilus assembly protein CpaE
MLLLLAPESGFRALATDYAPDDVEVLVVVDMAALNDAVQTHYDRIQAVVVGPGIEDDEALEAAAGLHGILPGLGVVLVRERAGTKLLKSAMRSGVHYVLSGTLNREEFVDVVRSAMGETALHRVRGRTSAPEPVAAGRVVTIFSTKGGCGKSVVATNLALMLSQQAPDEVVLVDLDLQSGDVAVLMQLLPEWTIHDAAVRGERLDSEQLSGFLTVHPEGLHVLAAPLQPEHAEGIDGHTTSHIIRLLRERFRFVVIDGPASFTDPLLAALDESDLTVVIASLDVPSVKGMRTTLHTLEQIGISPSRIRRLVNRADSRVGLTVRDVERSMGAPVDIAIPSSRDVPLSVNQGTPLALSNPSSPIVQGIDELRRLVLPDETTGEQPEPRRWFGFARPSES